MAWLALDRTIRRSDLALGVVGVTITAGAMTLMSTPDVASSCWWTW